MLVLVTAFTYGGYRLVAVVSVNGVGNGSGRGSGSGLKKGANQPNVFP